MKNTCAVLMPIRILLCAAFLLPCRAAETPQLAFEQISVAQGLSQSIVTNIMQDRRGFLWFGTEDGLNLYDGYGFTVLRTDPANPQSLSYNQVTALYEDRSGFIWVGTFNGGLNRYI
nr:two-component regulator propeller domain-containing protein [bacterium]